jgi:hypothetical protein
MTRVYLKHQASCLRDQVIDIDVDEACKAVLLSMKVFDSHLVGRLVTGELSSQHGIVAYQDDDQKVTEFWLTKSAAYQVFIDLNGVRFVCRVVKLATAYAGEHQVAILQRLA